MPSIGIDYTPALNQGGGIGRYVREIIRALAEADSDTDYRLFAAGRSLENLPSSIAPNFTWKPAPFNDRWLARIWHRAQLPLPVERFTGRVDLFHATDFTLPPTKQSTKTLLTVHDLSFIRAPETAVPSLKKYLDTVVPRSVDTADHIVADSEATRQDVIELYGVSKEKVTTLYSGVESRFTPITDTEQIAQIREKYQIGEVPYLLTVGTVQPRKNYERLVKAFSRLPNRADLRLVIAGGKGWLDGPLYQLIDDLDLTNEIIFAGFVDDADLPALYSGARLFVFPSLYEGFGLPPLEAMACGTPVIGSNTSSVPEVIGDAGILIDPLDEEQIQYEILRLLEDSQLRDTLREKGMRQAGKFTWEKSAQHLRVIYEELLA